RSPGARARRRRDGLRPGDGRLLAAPAGARFPGGRRPAGLGRARHPRRGGERRRCARGRARRGRPRGAAPGPRAARRTRLMSYPIISADSHITEPPNCYADHIDPTYRDRAPHIVHVEGGGDIYVIEGMKTPVPLGIVAAAAKGIADLEAIHRMGLRGVMMPGHPGVEDYDSPAYDAFWEAVIEIGLPLSFHILTTRDALPRGPRMNAFLSVIPGCQDIMGMLVLGGV